MAVEHVENGDQRSTRHRETKKGRPLGTASAILAFVICGLKLDACCTVAGRRADVSTECWISGIFFEGLLIGLLKDFRIILGVCLNSFKGNLPRLNALKMGCDDLRVMIAEARSQVVVP